MKKCLLLGASGFLGTALCQKLSSNYKLVAFDKYFHTSFPTSENINCVCGDFLTYDEFDRLLDGVETVIHLISTTIPTEGTVNIYREVEENILPTIRLLEAVGQSNVKQFIFASSAGTVYGETREYINTINSPLNPKSTYGLQKTLIESIIRFYSQQYNFKYQIMRISNPYGAGQSSEKQQGVIPILIRKLFSNEPVTVYGTTPTRNYIYMDDLLYAFECVLSYKGDVSCFNICTRDNISLPELLNLIEKESNRQFEKIIYEDTRSFDVVHSFLQYEDSQAELGWYPVTSLRDGIHKILHFYN